MRNDNDNIDRWRRYWDKHSASYDREMRFFDRVLFKDSRAWVCSQAAGEALEVGNRCEPSDACSRPPSRKST
jgi:hypothetical protein